MFEGMVSSWSFFSNVPEKFAPLFVTKVSTCKNCQLKKNRQGEGDNMERTMSRSV